MSQPDKVQQVVDLVKTTNFIDFSDIERVTKMQDILNINGYEAQEIWEILGYYEKGRLLWILNAVCGYETIQFYLQHTVLEEAKRKAYPEVYRDVRKKELEPEFKLVEEKNKILDAREHALKEFEEMLLKKEAELTERESAVKEREAALIKLEEKYLDKYELRFERFKCIRTL